ncbi:3,5-dihydroxyphenylacetyl-CoA synthase DpgA [Streptomyces sp. NPDC021969]|uniref:3,5-dihydroxyphenylacetyl-CoA synthase DpgA n=1 Tax=Streptomyces sp. NPDC021969 TaxID=3155250 RepID=UPI003400CF57
MGPSAVTVKAPFGLAGELPRIIGSGTATPPNYYTQEELLETFRVTDPKIRSIYLNSAIDGRFLTLPPELPDGSRLMETQGRLLAKHRENGVDMGSRALMACLKEAQADLSDVRYLVCVSSTGFLTPGLSALLIRELGIDPNCARLDVVGMGCNAGLNGLTAVGGWAAAHPGELAVLLCIEACSAAYVFDGTMRTSVVNSLFGDGSGALAVKAGYDVPTGSPAILKFASRIIPQALDAMRFDWDDDHGKFSFYLDRDVPYVVGANAEGIIDELLSGSGLRRSEIAHWVIHSGGKKVIDSVRLNLGLSAHDVRHTTNVLRDYGNLSSGSFLFSYQQLVGEGLTRPGDHVVFMTMGPGSTIETALVRC